jgi:CRP-like cAMP-binding protein
MSIQWFIGASFHVNMIGQTVAASSGIKLVQSQHLLSGIKLLKPLSGKQLEGLSQRCSWRNYAAGQRVVGYKDLSRDVYFIVSGAVRVKIFSVEGKEISYRDIGSGELFGELVAIDGGTRSADVIALKDSRIAAMSPETFWSLLRNWPDPDCGTSLYERTGR